MAAISNFDKRSYTWWWNSHISPKNSKWLQENLSDMDSKVKQMIKVIEEDADSFARRAEMYYKRRPELLQLVEEFYRAYRALAEKYDNATGVIRQAHRTMAEAFPDHVPSLLADEALAGDATSEGEPRTPETLNPARALFDPEEVLKDNAGLPHFHVKKTGAFTDEPDSVASKKGLKQLNELFGSREAEPGRAKFGEGRVRKELNFHENEEKGKIVGGRVLHKSEQVIRLEADMKLLKESLAKVEVEKETELLKYQQSLERLSNLESEVIRAKEDSRHLNECASKAEIEVQTLKETLANFNVEKEASLLKYEQCLERISNLEKNLSCAQEDAGELNRRTREAETEAQALKEELTLVKSEKEAIFVQHKQSLEVISDRENDLIRAEENARIIREKADATEKEIEKLKKDITRLTEENEALALQYQHCLVIISNLESKILSAEEEIQRLNGEIDVGLAKLRGAEDRCLSLERSNQSLQAEKNLLELKMGSQDQELTDKQQELARLWSCIQEERLRFVEAETAFQTLQHLHSQSQEELKSLVSELQVKGQVLEDLEIRNRVLQDDVLKTKEENKSLSVINLSSSASMKDMENELSDLKETIVKLQEEVDLRVDQRNALQQEIYCLKEELNELNKKQLFIVEQVESVGLNPECIASRVKELQNDNLKLNDVSQREKGEKEALLLKLEIMEKLLEKNAVLENSLADLNAELDGVREKVKSLEESCEMLMAEKSTLSSEKETLSAQLEMITENSHRLSEKNSLLESSLFDVNRELEGLRDKSNSLEHALQSVDREKDVLTTERESLYSQLEIARQRLEDSENRWKELEAKSNYLEKERESLLCTVEELRRSLDVEKQEHAMVLELCDAKVTTLESSLSNVNAELDEVTVKSQSIENSLRLLKNEKEGLIVERESLSSQLEITRDRLEESVRSIKDLEVKSDDLRKEKELLLSTIEELRGSLVTEKREHESILELHEAKFATLDSSLQDVNCELEGLREKTQNLEHLLAVVDGKKDGLIIENGSLSSQLETTQQKMEDLKKRCEELEGGTNDLEKEKQSLLCTVEELRSSLDVEKQDHASVLELYGTGLASLQSQILLLQEEGWQGKKKYEEELDKTIRAQIEIFILQKGLQEMEGKCITQSVECQRLFKTSEQLELSVCQLEHQNLKQEVEAKASLDQLENVRMVMYQVALAFDLDVDTWDDDEILRDQTYLKKILDNLEDLRKSLKKALEENWQLMAEKSVLSTLLSQFRLEATELETINSSLCEDLNVTTQKLLAVQSENHRLLEMNEGLRQVVVEGEKKEELSRIEIGSLQANLLVLHGAHEILQRQNSAVIEEKQSLMKEVLYLDKEKNALADEIILLLHETLCLSNLSLVFQNFISEKALVMKELEETFDKVCRVRNVLEMDVKVMVERLDTTNADNLHLKDSLEKSETELETVRLISDQLKFGLANSNSLLLQKEMELSEAEKKVEAAQSEKLEFQKVLGDLTMEYEQMKVIKGNQEECISKLSEENERRRMEAESLSEVISNLEAEISVICRKLEETKISEQTLNSELQKGRNEFKQWENDAELLFSRLHISTVHEALFTEMAYELGRKCVILENSENSKAEEIYLLKEKVGPLEDNIGGLEAQLLSYAAGIESLKNCLNSLESHTLLQDKLQKAVDEEAKGVQSSSYIDAGDGCEQNDNGASGLLELQSRIVAIEKAVDNLEKLQNKDLHSQIPSRDDSLSIGRYGSSRQDDGELPKDIMLDQVSECSPLGVSKRDGVEVNDPGLELWEATDGRIDQAKKQEIFTDENPSSEVDFEKELCVIDKSEISKRFKENSLNREGSKTKILERLDSDSQKLTNLQTIVQDLKAKVEITEKGKKEKAIEYDSVREQLEEAEETIMKLFDMNSKLKKNIEELDAGKSGRSFDDTEGNRSKRVSEHASRGSEKIGRLQLEVQKLQVLLLKLDGKRDTQGKTRMIKRSPRVALRDYLYGTKTTHSHKQKKARFCSCVRPPTKGD